jgi:hypothetical protein
MENEDLRKAFHCRDDGLLKILMMGFLCKFCRFLNVSTSTENFSMCRKVVPCRSMFDVICSLLYIAIVRNIFAHVMGITAKARRLRPLPRESSFQLN